MSETTPKVAAALESRAARQRALRIEFLRLDDRYAHRILAVGCEELPVTLLESVEGVPGDPSPPSPALQALNIDDLSLDADDSIPARVALLIGMSGNSHWSLSIVPQGESAAAPGESQLRQFPQIKFDGACRIKDKIASVGTEYRLGPRVAAQISGNQVTLDFGSGRCRLETVPTTSSSAVASWQIAKRRHFLSLKFPPLHAPAALPTTLRWAFSLALIDA